MVETKIKPGPDLTGGVVSYMDDVFGLYAVHTDSEEEPVNRYFDKVATQFVLTRWLPSPTSVEYGGKV